MHSVMHHLWNASTPTWYTDDKLRIVYFLNIFEWKWEIFGCFSRFLCWSRTGWQILWVPTITNNLKTFKVVMTMENFRECHRNYMWWLYHGPRTTRYLYMPVNSNAWHIKPLIILSATPNISVITTVAVSNHIKFLQLLGSTLWIDSESLQIPFPVIFRSVQFCTSTLW
jgi:hypothetical protein